MGREEEEVLLDERLLLSAEGCLYAYKEKRRFVAA